MKILGCLRASPPLPLHGKGNEVGIEEDPGLVLYILLQALVAQFESPFLRPVSSHSYEANIVYRQLMDAKKAPKKAEGVADAETEAGSDMAAVAGGADGEGLSVLGNQEEAADPVLTRAAALALEDLSAVFEHNASGPLSDDVLLRVGPGRCWLKDLWGLKSKTGQQQTITSLPCRTEEEDPRRRALV